METLLLNEHFFDGAAAERERESNFVSGGVNEFIKYLVAYFRFCVRQIFAVI